MANKNANLHAAKSAKNDEFYTLYDDINAELCHYVEHFKEKTVFCNCDDPESSNFWKFFVQNFHNYGIKKVVSTHYNSDGSPSYKLEYTGQELNGQQIWIKTELKGNGDFRSDECIKILKECDICCTNPPFSLFRAFVKQLMDYKKNFIIIGSKNAITYKDFFPLLKDNKVWVGYNSVKEFNKPDGTSQKFGNIGWYTNLDIKKRHELLLKPHEAHYKYYGHEDMYPKYDNYNAINVDKLTQLPDDYYDYIGVPITFIDKYNPDEFEIINANDIRKNLVNIRPKPHGLIKDKEASITTSCSQSVQVERERERERERKSERHMLELSSDVLAPGADGWHVGGKRKYARIFIRRRHKEKLD